MTARLLAGEGDLLPVSALPVDGTFPTGTTQFEKRAIAQEIPIWDPDICIDCGKCAIVCPHATIRMKVFGEAVAAAGRWFAANAEHVEADESERVAVAEELGESA